MRVDILDGCLLPTDDEVNLVLQRCTALRSVDQSLEILMLKQVLTKFAVGYQQGSCVDDYLRQLPRSFIAQVVDDINSMFHQKKAFYHHKHLSYFLYYFPANLFKVWKPLLDIFLAGILPAHIRLLDVGTGPGSVAVGVVEFYRMLADFCPDTVFSIKLVLLDAEAEFLSLATAMIEARIKEIPSNLQIVVEKVVQSEVSPPYNFLQEAVPFDLITASNFFTMNERENHCYATTCIQYLQCNLRPEGSLILIEPGDRQSCYSLKAIRNEIIKQKIMQVFSPCVGILEEKQDYNCNCFNMVRYYWKLPSIYHFLQKHGLNKASRTTIPFNYLVLRLDQQKKYTVLKNHRLFTPLVEISQKIDQTVQVVARIRTIIYKPGHISLSLCDGSYSIHEDRAAVWLYTTESAWKKHGITLPLLSGERIRLKGVTVRKRKAQLLLELGEKSKIEVEY